MAIDKRISLGNIITFGLIVVSGLVFYFTTNATMIRMLENHEVRIGETERKVELHDSKIFKLYQTKADKN